MIKQTLIKDIKKASQVIDYYGSSLDKNFKLTGDPIIQFSDIDGFMEQHRTFAKPYMKYKRVFLFVEHKTLLPDGKIVGMPKGQEDSYLSLIEALGESKNNFALLAECYHDPVPEGETVKSHNCYVRRVYSSESKKWTEPKYEIGLPELVVWFYKDIGIRLEGKPTEEEADFLKGLRGGHYGLKKPLTV